VTTALVENPQHEALFALEAHMRAAPPVDVPLEHAFCQGVYARTVRIPAGTLVMGAIHRDECFFIVREGTIRVSTGSGDTCMTAGDMVISPAGSKRAGLAITDAVVTTFHANPQDEHDDEKIWDMLTIAPPDNALPMHRMKELSNA